MDDYPQGTADHAPGLPLALGFGAALYHMRTKASSLPRSAGITALGLSAGTLLGVALQAALRVDIIPLGPLSTPSTVVAEGALAGMFAVRAMHKAIAAAATRAPPLVPTGAMKAAHRGADKCVRHPVEKSSGEARKLVTLKCVTRPSSSSP
jgi:hypothetical protein